MKWWQEIAGGLVGTAGSVVGNILGTKNTQSRAMQNWMTQQEYNHPANQMKRLQEAGINPHLAFAKGNINNVSTSQPNTPELKIDKGFEEFMKYQQISNLKAQNDLIRAQAEKTYAEARSADVAAGIAENTVSAEIQKSLSQSATIQYGEMSARERAEQEQAITEMKNIEASWMRDGVTKNDNVLLRQLVTRLAQNGASQDAIALGLGLASFTMAGGISGAMKLLGRTGKAAKYSSPAMLGKVKKVNKRLRKKYPDLFKK